MQNEIDTNILDLIRKTKAFSSLFYKNFTNVKNLHKTNIYSNSSPIKTNR
jgi:hypothetical protein